MIMEKTLKTAPVDLATGKNTLGFTLLETLIYLLLFTIVIGGGMVATYNVIESTAAGRNQIILQEEANFLFRKIDWALTGSIINSVGGSTLVIYKNSNTHILTQSGSNLTIDGSFLNSGSILVSNLVFADIPANGAKPRGIKTSFTLTTSQSGRPETQD